MSTKSSIASQCAVGALPVVMFFAFCGLTAVMETYALIPGLLALISVSVATPVVILWSETTLTAMVAALVSGALIAVGIAMGSWLVIPAALAFMLPTASVTMVARLRARPEGETWGDTGLEVLAGILAFGLAVVLIWGLDTATIGLMLLAVLAACLEVRRRAPPLPE
ncbi:MAG TPA: hypothetical protein VL426_02305 [Candidatus Binatia bacterium]|nr:hypothetical protein [Candidatus Binatia bacterium]